MKSTNLKKNMGFKYERKRIKRDKKLPPLCPDYQPIKYSDCCEKAKLCKNATYGFEGTAWGNCYGGTRSSEREDRKKRQERKMAED